MTPLPLANRSNLIDNGVVAFIVNVQSELLDFLENTRSKRRFNVQHIGEIKPNTCILLLVFNIGKSAVSPSSKQYVFVQLNNDFKWLLQTSSELYDSLFFNSRENKYDNDHLFVPGLIDLISIVLV